MQNYCCFFCPLKDKNEKKMDDVCPTCNRRYSYPLDFPPKEVGSYQVIKPLSRGFYGATYIAKTGAFSKKIVLKVTPVSFYDFFAKRSFEQETDLHFRVAKDADHVVGIEDRFDAVIRFSDGEEINCHIAVLEFVDGISLVDYLSGSLKLKSSEIFQVAIDLLKIRGEFYEKELNHNDLHANNLIVEQLSPGVVRSSAISQTIRLKAIDLGSIAEQDLRSEERKGDLEHISDHVENLLEILLKFPSDIEDREYRTALALQQIVSGMRADSVNSRSPETKDLIRKIEQAYYRASRHWRPWSQGLRFKGFGDDYNAQTLDSWNVPKLLVDPDGHWLAEVSKPGPQIITGMRGCGKTMLLRALDIHARASGQDGEHAKKILERLAQDRYVGLFVSAQRLLELRSSSFKIQNWLARLFVNYSLQASRALLHIQDLDREALAPGAHSTLAHSVADVLSGVDHLLEVKSVEELEAQLERLAVKINRDSESFSISLAPAQAFGHLASQIRFCSSVFSESMILFLLDDVSTRYLALDGISELLSSLLFQSPVCAFKFTSEWQTIELGLQSPGRNHPVRIDRDVSVFDLGADVYKTIASTKGRGNDFVESILIQRSRFHVAEASNYRPKTLLGDVTLERVAEEIASSGVTSSKRKQSYRGLTCLTSVCVGDIGDVIKLYEQILRRSEMSGRLITPIPNSIQSECFLDISSKRIYDLDRRTKSFKKHALSFASAANNMLVASYRYKKNKGGSARIRQYSSIYVRVSDGDESDQQRQIDDLRELIDAGVFVYSGGAARTKTRDPNPIQQFKLSYRKIYGLASFIGLADRDRFELSGDSLKRWLEEPSEEILLRDQGELREAADVVDSDNGLPEDIQDVANEPMNPGFYQESLFDSPRRIQKNAYSRRDQPKVKDIDCSIERIAMNGLESFESLLCGFGFEDRTLESTKRISRNLSVKNLYGVEYSFPGHKEKMKKIWERKGAKVHSIKYDPGTFTLPGGSPTLIDISGLSKPVIFLSIRQQLLEFGSAYVVHTAASKHYPTTADLQTVWGHSQGGDHVLFLERLATLLKGEKGPYTQVPLLKNSVDQSRLRALLSFSSAKHERLFSLLDSRDYDVVQILASDGDELRSKVSQVASDFVSQKVQNATSFSVNASELSETLSAMDMCYIDMYQSKGANVEIGLTGSKIQAVASAIVCARRKVSEVWYTSPAEFDPDRFSEGVGRTRVIKISLL